MLQIKPKMSEPTDLERSWQEHAFNIVTRSILHRSSPLPSVLSNWAEHGQSRLEDEPRVANVQFVGLGIDHESMRVEMQADGVDYTIGVGGILLDNRKPAQEPSRVNTVEFRVESNRIRSESDWNAGHGAAPVQIKNHQSRTLAA